MATVKERKDGVLYESSGNGVHKWEITTQKPFAEFKDELNQAYDNSWVRAVIRIAWTEKRVNFTSWGAEGELTWDNGKVSAVLRVQNIPATWFEQKIVYETRQMLIRTCAYARTAEIEAENKESLRQSALETYREAYVNEVEASVLIGRWQTVDEFTKVLVALTSSGSAVAGWLVWNQPVYKQTWAALAGGRFHPVHRECLAEGVGQSERLE